MSSPARQPSQSRHLPEPTVFLRQMGEVFSIEKRVPLLNSMHLTRAELIELQRRIAEVLNG